MPQTPQELVDEAKKGVPMISVDELIALQKSDAPRTIIDVREENEWDEGHIEGAIHIPRGYLEFKIENTVPDKDSLVIVHCARGSRAALCGQVMQKLGYTNVKNLEGGYRAYIESTQK